MVLGFTKVLAVTLKWLAAGGSKDIGTDKEN